jgi:hypothetical protein
MRRPKSVAGSTTGEQQLTLYGGPTKRFFVSMLTRDIELKDAILDLIDNCVDGAMRQQRKKLAQAAPFKGFKANLLVSSNRFELADNCGGIPDDYINDAFSLGRPNIKKDGDLPTIGMYGIGMKRAIFKITDAASVESNSKESFFRVEYDSSWLDPENDDWDLPLTKGPSRRQRLFGVTIAALKVKPDIAKQFRNDSFMNNLRETISEHFGYLIQKGFSIHINKDMISASTLWLFTSEPSRKPQIAPFDYEAMHDSVSIRVTIGFFRSLAREAEIDEETVSPREVDSAGISIVCNDRVIVLGDRTMRVGWGDGGVPRYHPQFRAIAGLIVFSSTNADKLPIATTKRDLDVGSEVYLIARRAAMEGLKLFTDFTNKWKGMEDEAADFFKPANRADVRTHVALARKHGKPVRGESQARKFKPSLPLPPERNPRRRVSFVRDERQIEAVSKYLFGDAAQHPSIVGAECFDRTAKEAKIK